MFERQGSGEKSAANGEITLPYMAFYIRDRRLTFDMSVIDTCTSRWLVLVRRGRCGLKLNAVLANG